MPGVLGTSPISAIPMASKDLCVLHRRGLRFLARSRGTRKQMTTGQSGVLGNQNVTAAAMAPNVVVVNTSRAGGMRRMTSGTGRHPHPG